MKVEEQGENYFILNLLQEGKLDHTALEKLQSEECLLPFELVDSERKCVRYHVGNYIPLKQYLNMKELNFSETKDLFLSIISNFEKIKNSGGKQANILEDLYYVYINPVSLEYRFVYLPVVLEVNPDNFLCMMKEILFLLQSNDAELVLGCVVDAIRAGDNCMAHLKQRLFTVDSNVQVLEKTVEVDRVVEKTIEKQVSKRENLGESIAVTAIIYAFDMILLPFLLCDYLEPDLLATPKIINNLLCLFAILSSSLWAMSRARRIMKKEKMVVTMEPQKKEKK